MSAEQSTRDPSRSTIVSRSPGMAYERMRTGRASHFAQPLVRKLTAEGVLLLVVAATVLRTGGGSPAAAGTPDPVALAGGTVLIVALGALVHAAVGLYRLRREPLTERQALALVSAEDAASYLAIGTGSILTGATVLVAVVRDPAGASATSGAALGVAAVAVVAGVLALAAARYVRRLPDD